MPARNQLKSCTFIFEPLQLYFIFALVLHPDLFFPCFVIIVLLICRHGFSLCLNSFSFCSQADEIYKICSVIGSPNRNSWAEGLELANVLKYQFPQVEWVYLLSLRHVLVWCCIFLIIKETIIFLVRFSKFNFWVHLT